MRLAGFCVLHVYQKPKSSAPVALLSWMPTASDGITPNDTMNPCSVLISPQVHGTPHTTMKCRHSWLEQHVYARQIIPHWYSSNPACQEHKTWDRQVPLAPFSRPFQDMTQSKLCEANYDAYATFLLLIKLSIADGRNTLTPQRKGRDKSLRSQLACGRVSPKIFAPRSWTRIVK